MPPEVYRRGNVFIILYHTAYLCDGVQFNNNKREVSHSIFFIRTVHYITLYRYFISLSYREQRTALFMHMMLCYVMYFVFFLHPPGQN